MKNCIILKKANKQFSEEISAHSKHMLTDSLGNSITVLVLLNKDATLKSIIMVCSPSLKLSQKETEIDM